jgi:hypothetical protein
MVSSFNHALSALRIWRIFQKLREHVSSTYPVLPSDIWIILWLQRSGILWKDRKFYNSLQLRWTEIYWPIITPRIVFPRNFSKMPKIEVRREYFVTQKKILEIFEYIYTSGYPWRSNTIHPWPLRASMAISGPSMTILRTSIDPQNVKSRLHSPESKSS